MNIVGLALAISCLGVAIWIVAGSSWGYSEAATDAVVAFSLETPCQATHVEEGIHHDQLEPEIDLKRPRCLAKTSEREAVPQFDAIQAQTEQQPGVKR